jgi:site-specific DNA-methyltransferase (adenine-specific)
MSTCLDLKLADAREYLPTIAAETFDAVCCDPPYEISFMAAAWDSSGVTFDPKLWASVHRVLKPGAAALVFCIPKKQHRVALALEEAGFEIQDVLMWFFTTGMPKAKTDLKPAYEPVLLARKGKGRLFVERALVPYKDAADLAATKAKNPGRKGKVTSAVYGGDRPQQLVNEEGRRPTNVLMDEGVAADIGNPSRIVFVPKVRKDRIHPTEKPVELMRHLLRLVCPEGGYVLDPFAGSGSTRVAAHMEGMRALGIEKAEGYFAEAKERLRLVTSG